MKNKKKTTTDRHGREKEQTTAQDSATPTRRNGVEKYPITGTKSVEMDANCQRTVFSLCRSRGGHNSQADTVTHRPLLRALALALAPMRINEGSQQEGPMLS